MVNAGAKGNGVIVYANKCTPRKLISNATHVILIFYMAAGKINPLFILKQGL